MKADELRGRAQTQVYIGKGKRKESIHNIKIDPVQHGKYRVSEKWSDVHIPGSPFMLKIYLKHSKTCKAYGPGLNDGYTRKENMFKIDTKDAGVGTLKVN